MGKQFNSLPNAPSIGRETEAFILCSGMIVTRDEIRLIQSPCGSHRVPLMIRYESASGTERGYVFHHGAPWVRTSASIPSRATIHLDESFLHATEMETRGIGIRISVHLLCVRIHEGTNVLSTESIGRRLSRAGRAIGHWRCVAYWSAWAHLQ
jgi:hypothetical protein